MAEVYVILVTDRTRMLQFGYDDLRIVYKTDIKINDRQGFLRGIKKSTKGQLNIISLHYEPEKHGMEMGKSVRPSAGAPPTRTK